MTEIEQIEEMARLMEEPCVGSCKACEYYPPKCAIPCMNLKRAKIIYSKGYRKLERGEWIVTDADSGSFGEYAPFIEFKCPKCESCYGIESGQYDWRYGDPIPWVSCPLCGADMKGE